MAAYWEIAAHSAYYMFPKYKNLIVNLVFSHLGVWSGNVFLIAPFPDHCLLEVCRRAACTYILMILDNIRHNITV